MLQLASIMAFNRQLVSSHLQEAIKDQQCVGASLAGSKAGQRRIRGRQPGCLLAARGLRPIIRVQNRQPVRGAGAAERAGTPGKRGALHAAGAQTLFRSPRQPRQLQGGQQRLETPQVPSADFFPHHEPRGTPESVTAWYACVHTEEFKLRGGEVKGAQGGGAFLLNRVCLEA